MLDELKRLACLVFGHRMPPQGWWGDGLYGEVKGGYRDNCGRSHFTVRQTCPRCGDKWITARFHGENPTIIAAIEAKETK